MLSSFYRKIFIISCQLLYIGFGYSGLQAQGTCPSAFVQNICLNSDVAVGTQTELAATYTWYKGGKVKKGPVSGDGGAISFNFPVTSTQDTGYYTIEKTVDGTTTCVTNILVQIVPLPAPQTMLGDGALCNLQKTLSLSNSEADVSYELWNSNGPVETINRSVAGAFAFSPVYNSGIYTVKAYKNSCSNYDSSYVRFGNARVTDLPDPATVNYTTTTSANISWPGNGAFIMEVGLKGFVPGTGATKGGGIAIFSGTGSSVTFNSLSPATNYDVYVRVNCSPGVYTSSLVTHFTTDCASITSFPYTQGFETVTPPVLPPCWTLFHNSDNGYNYIFSFNIPAYARTGNNYLYASGNKTLILPGMTLTGSKRLKYFVNSSNGQSVYQVLLSTTNNAESSFTTTLFTDTVLQAGYREKTISLSAFSGPVYLAIRVLAGYLRFDDFTVENTPACPGPTFVYVESVGKNSATCKWTGNGSYIVEYGPAGFTPGTGTTPGAGGTVIPNATSPLTITGLSTLARYDIFIRQNCVASGNGFSSNSPRQNFSTFYNCGTSIPISECSNITATATSLDTGIVDFNGIYPNNSCGVSTPGKELLYSFTPATTGVYYLEVVSASTGNPVSYLYKAASQPCGSTGWTGIYSFSDINIGKQPIGMLEADSTYLIMLDGETLNGFTQQFRICKAQVAAYSICNLKIAVNKKIPAFSNKKEYVLDDNGNLIAELDFGAMYHSIENLEAFYTVYSGSPARRDRDNKEYLSRDFTITSQTNLVGSVGLKFYFLNSELQQLINEPKDGIADVNAIGDLGVTQTAAINCTINRIGIGEYLPQLGHSSYDWGLSSYVQTASNGWGRFYLHGGSTPLSSDNMVQCPGVSVQIKIPSLSSSAIYQWQVDDGTGYVNLSDVNYFSGVNTETLTISNAPTFLYGYKFRCRITLGGNTLYSNPTVLKFSMTWNGSFDSDWLNPRNWDCGTDQSLFHIPDANTDVIIPDNLPFFNSLPSVTKNSFCRSLTLGKNQSISIEPGIQLIITGKQ